VKKSVFACFFVSLFLTTSFVVAQDKNAKIEAVRLTGNIYKFVLNDIVNVIALVGPDGVLLVDSGFDKNPANGFINSPAAIKEDLKKIGNDDIRYIIDTHTDIDHAYGNAELGQHATIMAHALGRERLSAMPQFPKPGLPSLTFQDSLQLFFNNEEINVFHLPGHTNHDIVVHFKNARIVCVGDLIIPDSFGSISRTGDVHAMIKAIDILYNRFADDVTFVAGHDRNLQKKDLMPYKDMIEKTLAIIEKVIKKGTSLEQMQKDDILKGWRKWDGVLFKELDANGWITMIYANIIKKLKPSAAEKLGEILRRSGYGPAKDEIHVLLGRKSRYYFVEAEFNVLGYNLINEGKLNDAIEIFKVTVGLYPDSWNAYDSLGEAYALAGNKELAIANYERSLKLNPDSPSGTHALKQLKAKTN
jgi:glyoxylase-like metal-dependent hydrolase (beta-lactamase superfamily II)